MENFEQSWQDLLKPFSVDTALADSFFEELRDRYSEPGRYYHTLVHIGHVLRTINELAAELEVTPAVHLVGWYHDAIYDSRAHDNEEKSAELAAQHLQSLGLPAEVITETVRLVLLTKRHTTAPDDTAGRVLLDADLAILGADPEHYQNYTRQIRLEYAWVEAPAYREGRRKVLESFQTRPRLYATDQLFARLETAARHNIAAEIARLSA